jgi:hypothetical protein
MSNPNNLVLEENPNLPEFIARVRAIFTEIDKLNESCPTEVWKDEPFLNAAVVTTYQ